MVKLSTALTWVLLTFLVQMLVTQWTVEAAGNRDVIDYVSFAGTVVGMILAFLAIVYSFLTAASQRNDAENLKGQLISLNEAIGRVKISGAKFEDEVEKLEDIRSGLANLEAVANTGVEATSRVEAKFDAFFKGEFKEKANLKKDATPQVADANKESLLRIAGLPTSSQILHYFVALHSRYDGNHIKLQEEIIHPVLVADNISFWRSYSAGEVSAYHFIFQDLGGLRGELKAEFLKTLRVRIDAALTRMAKEDYVRPKTFDHDKMIEQLKKIASMIDNGDV